MSEQCYHYKFFLFVTGKGEKEHLPNMFSALAQSGICSFVFDRRIGQRRPRTATAKLARMARTGQKIPNKDWEEITAPVRKCLNNNCHRIILIDDLEWSDEWSPGEIFERYRSALDEGLSDPLKQRASVHFLVNMLEAYFFADPDAINHALKLTAPIGPHDGDVETIRNPKSLLRQSFPSYNEIKHAGLILDKLDLDTVLSDPAHCSSLRTCVRWIVDQLQAYPDKNVFDSFNFEERFHLRDGQLYAATSNQ